MRKPLRFKRKKKRISFLKLRFFWYITGALFFLTFLFWIVIFSPWLKIQEVKIQGANKVLTKQILFAVEDNLWKKFLNIPQNSILLFNTKDMEKKLSFAFPLISHILLERSLPSILVVKVEEREQIGTWCKIAEKDNGTVCFAIDAKGVIFKEVKKEDSYVVFTTQGEPIINQELLKSSLLSTLFSFKERFQKAGELLQFSITDFKIRETGDVEAVTKEGWKILLNLKENIEWQQTKLELVLQQKIPLEKRGKLKYIDLRFGSQAYIKYQD